MVLWCFRRCSGIDVCVVFGLFCACGLPGLLDLILYSCELFGVVWCITLLFILFLVWYCV